MVGPMERVDTDPDDFLEAFADESVRTTMQRLDQIIRAALPGRNRTLWEGVFWGGTDQSILGYGDIVQPRPKGETVEWFLVGLARQKDSYSLYVNAVEDGAYIGQGYADRLRAAGVAKSRVKIGSASIGFGSLDDVDVEVLAELLGRADELTPPDERS